MAHTWGSKFMVIASIFLHYSYMTLPFRGYWNSWIGPSTKTTKIGTPRNLNHPQYCFDVMMLGIILLQNILFYCILVYLYRYV